VITNIYNNIPQKCSQIKEKAVKKIQKGFNGDKRSILSTLLEYPEEQKIDLIVIGTRDRSAIKIVLFVRIASGLVAYAPNPVLVLR
jgi:hypothetical protein